MKNRIKTVVLLLLLSNMAVYAQTETDMLDIQKNTVRVPHSKSKKPDVLADYLTAKYEDDSSKSYAISHWIAHRIKYDCKGYINHRTELYNSEKVLKKRKALCEEYANLYKEMCESVGIQALVVTGYAKVFDFSANDTVYSSNHAWNISLINGKRQLADHTYASGKILPRKQLLKRYTLGLLGISYKPKFYFKQQYDPNWIAVNPKRMIRSHFPDLQLFQLLQNPVSVSEFSRDTIFDELLPIVENPLIDNYIAMPFQKKMIYSVQKGKETNPFNNRMLGYQYFMLVDDLFKTRYNPKTKSFNLSVDELFQMKNYAFLSDSLLKLARKDNDANYQQKQRQNQQMRNELKINNKTLADSLQKRIKQNRINIKTSVRLQKKSQKMLKYFERQRAVFLSRKPLEATKRPIFPQAEEDKILELLSQLDSIQNKVVPAQLSQIDSLNAIYTTDNIVQNVLTEQQPKAVYPVLSAELKTMEKRYALGIPFLIHKYPHYIEKQDFANEIHSLDSLKKQHTDKMMSQLRKNQNSFSEQTKLHAKSTKECLNLLKSIKIMSHEQHNEDAYFAKIIAEYVDNLPKFEKYAEMYRTSQKELANNLKSQNKKIEKILSRLKKEHKTENYRYRLYAAYRKNYRTGENIRIKSIQKRLNKYRTAIEKNALD
ncbi:MAG: hypothetical protein FWH36_05010 [Lentimicrobiaceae bacterium]|nr:hypothetical protein [Lentimicrobiaceae bacterium]